MSNFSEIAENVKMFTFFLHISSQDIQKYISFSASQCSSNEYPCGSGDCVPGFVVCDGKADCIDGSDEFPDVCGVLCFS